LGSIFDLESEFYTPNSFLEDTNL